MFDFGLLSMCPTGIYLFFFLKPCLSNKTLCVTLFLFFCLHYVFLLSLCLLACWPPSTTDAKCFCGTADEFEGAVSSDECGATFASLCTGDSTTACGGNGALSIYQRTGDAGPSPTPAPVDPTPAPIDTVDETPAPMASFPGSHGPTLASVPPTLAPVEQSGPTAEPFSVLGCFTDSQSNRVMIREPTDMAMTAEVS